MTEVIQTRRLVLRRFRRGDADALVALLNNLDVARWLTRVPHPYRPEHACDFIDNVAEKSADAFAVSRDDQVIGGVSTGEQLGYWIGQPFWRNGYVTEAAQAMITRFFNRRDGILHSGYHVGNKGSCAVLTKLGFLPTDQRQAMVLSLGCETTIQNMSLSRTRWEAMQ